MKKEPKIFVGTPCYGGMLTADYFKSCLRLVNEAPKHNIELQFGTIGNESLITRARNTLVQLFMDDPGKYTHLLFIDADIGFSEKTVKTKNTDLTQKELETIVPNKWLLKAHSLLILHGRYICKARNPECYRRVVNDLCMFKNKNFNLKKNEAI